MVNEGFTLHPGDYSLHGFTHEFCRGCANEYSPAGFQDIKAAMECELCIEGTIDVCYKGNKPIYVTKDERGKNVVKLENKEKQQKV